MKKVTRMMVCLTLALALAATALMSGCGGGKSGATHETNAARVTGLVAVPSANAGMARVVGSVEGKKAAAAQTPLCGTLPAGYVAIPNATVTYANGKEVTTTDSDGCFSMNVTSFGTTIFTVVGNNSDGGVTTLKKAASISPNTSVSLVNDKMVSVQSTVAAIIVEQKIKAGEKDVDPAAVEAYVEIIKDGNEVQTMQNAIIASAAKNPSTPFSSISSSTITTTTDTTEKPVIVLASVTGSPVAWTGGSVSITCRAASYKGTVTSVTATLTADGKTPIAVTMSNTTGNNYAGSYDFGENAGDSVTYAVTITVVDSNSISNSYSSSSLNITQEELGAVCGNGSTETGEQCDDGNTVTEACVYGETSCTVCDATCQNAAGAVSYCGDGTTQTANSETCDDGANNGTPNHCNSSCDGTVPATCGNDAVEVGEECDTGGESSTCNTDCTNAACGDSVTNSSAGETCDDGNAVTEECAYGETSCTVCDSACHSSAGASSYCGDSITDTANNETCDAGSQNKTTCYPSSVSYLPEYGSVALPDTSCSYCSSATCQTVTITHVCGDGTVQENHGEQCDDGNNTSGDGCTNNCQIEECGDSIVNTGETCDDGNAVTEACDYGATSCTVCDATCQSVAGETSICGDSTTDAANGESCDDGNTVTEACSYGQTSCAVCDSTCQSVDGTTSYCGDNVIDEGNGEACDDGGAVDGDGCSATCQTEVAAVSPPVAVGTSGNITCVLLQNGKVMCAGSGAGGNLGNTSYNSNTPYGVEVTGLTDVTAMNAGYQLSCAVISDGTVKCWGSQTSGALTTITGVSNAVALSGKGVNQSYCAIISGGTVRCWGYNSNGQLGDGSTTSSMTDSVAVQNITDAIAISSGESTSCAVLSGGTVQCWGRNNFGQLGNGNTTDSSVPVTVTGIDNAVSVMAGYTSCAVLSTGGVKCWGYGTQGQLGNGSSVNSSTPVDVTGITNADSVYGGGQGQYFVCALLSTSGVKCWGTYPYSGLNINSNTPADLPGFTSGVDAMDISMNAVCAIIGTNSYCVGYGESGQLGGLSFTSDNPDPVKFWYYGECGDSYTYPPTEQCDYGTANGSNGLCTASCMSTGVCGNGYVDNGEECDDGNNVDTDACSNACLSGGCALHTDPMACMDDFANNCMWLGGTCQSM